MTSETSLDLALHPLPLRPLQVKQQQRLDKGLQLEIHSVTYGAYRWTDAEGAAYFKRTTHSSPGPGCSDVVGVAPAPTCCSEAIALTNQNTKSANVVDPIPRIDWRAWFCFKRRGFENAVVPIVLVEKTGACMIAARAPRPAQVTIVASGRRGRPHLGAGTHKAQPLLRQSLRRHASARGLSPPEHTAASCL